MARRHGFLPPTLAPIGLSREEAAAYIGVSAGLFDAMVRDGRMPAAKRIEARRVWDRRAVERAFAAIDDGGCAAEQNPWDDAA
jgi:hypothetical protein